jgi:transcriptional regulator with XRE-family HTH domain
MDETHLIRILRAEMKHRGIGQKRLALSAGLHPDAVRNIFRGISRAPRMETIRALADYLGVSVDYLFGREAAEAAESTVEGGSTVPTIPVRKPGSEEWEEVRQFWAAASPDARRALVYLARTMARAEGIEPVKRVTDQGQEPGRS